MAVTYIQGFLPQEIYRLEGKTVLRKQLKYQMQSKTVRPRLDRPGVSKIAHGRPDSKCHRLAVIWSLWQLLNSAIVAQKQPRTVCKQVRAAVPIKLFTNTGCYRLPTRGTGCHVYSEEEWSCSVYPLWFLAKARVSSFKILITDN